ncbi:cupin domain-containing protein [Nocardioides sp. NPDC051685]|uniref:cupin domain-containing protein n=1 Tax=Nocardioides sp. NPDC051685 TaxID=3364334 RepID=UPI0037ABF564
MAIASEFELVVAACDADGKSHFIEAGSPATMEIPGALDGAFLWSTGGVASLPTSIGAAPADMSFPGPGGSNLGVFRFPARSAGKLDVAALDRDDVEGDAHGDAGMHRTDTIDYEIIISGKVDIELPGGQVRTLSPGSILVMAGAPHAWRNHYDEDCTYVAVVVGANAPTNVG